MDQKPPLRKAALALTTIIAANVAPSQSRAIGTGSWNRIVACPEWASSSAEPFYHQVNKGDNLWTITRKYNEGKVFGSNEQGKQIHYPTWIATANHQKTSDFIHPGQSLVVPWKKKVEYYCR